MSGNQTVQGEKISGEVDFPKQAQGFHGFYDVGATQWSVDSDGDIRDGELLVAEPSYLTRDGHKNAALIAAAPDLLAVCEKALELFRTGCVRLNEYDNKDLELRSALIKTIAKARGV